MRSSLKGQKAGTKERLLLERIKELEEKLAASVPKAEFEAVKSNFQLEIDDLQRRLTDSVPRADLDYIRVKDEVKRLSTEKIQEPEPKLSESVPGGELEAVNMEAESRFVELQQALSDSKKEADALREKIRELQSRK